ncbi:MAG: hypothetical protein IJY28_00370, partial [Clostridia bacterium]|nr:hypothetical protein [Clostridia bacterium]
MNTETELWQQYENGLEYQRSMGFRTNFPMYIRFKEGEQWAAPTARTRNLPRPVFNIVEMFIRHKRAAVLNQSVALSYAAEEDGSGDAGMAVQGARDLTDYAQQLWEHLDQDGLNREMMDDAATLGSGILHYYYDTEVIGDGRMPFVGEIRGENIDPLNIFFGDPQQREVQKQPYIIIASRRRVREVQEMARHAGLPERVCRAIGRDEAAMDEAYDAARIEVRDEDKCTVLTRYYRINGQVYFDRATRTADLVRRQSLTPAGRRPMTM